MPISVQLLPFQVTMAHFIHLLLSSVLIGLVLCSNQDTLSLLLRKQALKHELCTNSKLTDRDIGDFEECESSYHPENKIKRKCLLPILASPVDRKEAHCGRLLFDSNDTLKFYNCLDTEREASGCNGTCTETPSVENLTTFINCSEVALKIDVKKTSDFFDSTDQSFKRITALTRKYCNVSQVWPQNVNQNAQKCTKFDGIDDEATVSTCSSRIWEGVRVDENVLTIEQKRALFCRKSFRTMFDKMVMSCVIGELKKVPKGVGLELTRPLWKTKFGIRIHPYDDMANYVRGELRRANCLDKAMKPSTVIVISE